MGKNVVLVGLVPAWAGMITLADEEITGLPSRENLHIGGQLLTAPLCGPAWTSTT